MATVVAIKKRDQELRFIECRSLGHEWRKQSMIGVDDTDDTFRRPYGMSTGMIGIPSSCHNCGTRKVRWITRSGESLTRYEHPDGYSRHGDDRLTHQEYRHEYVTAIWAAFEVPTGKVARKA